MELTHNASNPITAGIERCTGPDGPFVRKTITGTRAPTHVDWASSTEPPADELAAAAEVLLAAYLRGTRSSGFPGDEAVQTGFRAAGVKWVWLGPLHLQRALTGGHHVYGGGTDPAPTGQYIARGLALAQVVSWTDAPTDTPTRAKPRAQWASERSGACGMETTSPAGVQDSCRGGVDPGAEAGGRPEDQRGSARPTSSGSNDAGSFELPSGVSTTLPSTTVNGYQWWW